MMPPPSNRSPAYSTPDCPGVTARAAFVIGPDAKVRYVQLCPEIAEEPDYAAILAQARA